MGHINGKKLKVVGKKMQNQLSNNAMKNISTIGVERMIFPTP
jgi:hypothetical protein